MRKILYYCFSSPFAALSKATVMMYRVIWEEKNSSKCISRKHSEITLHGRKMNPQLDIP